jgi:hypothetical protein
MHIQTRALPMIIFIFTFLLTACGSQALTPSPESAVLNQPAGTVSVQPKADADFIHVLNEGGQIQTGDDGRVRLDFSTGTILRVGPSSLFKLESNASNENSLITTIRLELGKAWIILNGGQMQVETSSGQASVRGSYMSVEMKDGVLRVTCLEGTCTFRNESGEYPIPAGSVLESTGPGEIPVITSMTEVDLQEWLVANPEAAGIVDALKAAATPTFTLTATVVITSTPEATFTPAFTETPVPPASMEGEVDAALLSCRYGPGASYLYLYGLSKNLQVEVIGKAETADGLWLYIKASEYDRPCWVSSRFLQVEGEPTTLEQVYPHKAPLILFQHDRFPPVTDVSASRSGDRVDVSWSGYELALGDRESAESPQYLVEFWTCEAGRIVFTAYGSFEEAAVIQDEAGCAEPSHGQVYIAHKDGYVGPVAIPWPAQ